MMLKYCIAPQIHEEKPSNVKIVKECKYLPFDVQSVRLLTIRLALLATGAEARLTISVFVLRLLLLLLLF